LFLDVGCDDSLLPASKPASQLARSRLFPVGMNKLIHEHGAECLEIRPIRRRNILEQAVQFHRRTPERQILEQQARCELAIISS
jgi:hypothetical protein